MTKITAASLAEIVRADYERRREAWVKRFKDDQGFDQWYSVQVVSPRRIDQRAFRADTTPALCQGDFFKDLEGMT
jgi:hypothetical protein